jgi:hypothetical protein
MSSKSFSKALTSNDDGKTGSHQVGLHIPQKNIELLEFLPTLDVKTLNPSTWITCFDIHNESWRFKFVYYNNKFHSLIGWRNEFRLTRATKYLRSNSAFENDTFLISKVSNDDFYRVKLIQKSFKSLEKVPSKLKLFGWRRIYKHANLG